LKHPEVKKVRVQVEGGIDDREGEALRLVSGLNRKQSQIFTRNELLPSEHATRGARGEFEDATPDVYFMREGSSSVATNPRDVILAMLNVDDVWEHLEFDDDGVLYVLIRGDGSSHGHFKSYPFYAECLAFLNDPRCTSEEYNTIIALARMVECRDSSQRILSKLFRLLKLCEGTVLHVRGRDITIRLLRVSDGAEMAKVVGTAGFSARRCCTRCTRRRDRFHVLTCIGQTLPPGDVDLPRCYVDSACELNGHPVASCACAVGCLRRLHEKYPAADHDGFSAEDKEHPKHKEIVEYAGHHTNGYAYHPINLGNVLPEWGKRIFYDPFHLDLNCYKPLFRLITLMYEKLDSANLNATNLSDMTMTHLDVGQDADTKAKLRAKDDVRAVADTGSLNGKDMALLQNATVPVMWDGSMINIATVLKPMHLLATTCPDERRQMAADFFTVVEKLTRLNRRISELTRATGRVDHSANARPLIKEYYSAFYDVAGLHQIASYEHWVDWPNHYRAEHLADDMRSFFDLTGFSLGRVTCQPIEAINKAFKAHWEQHTNRHLSTSNLADNALALYMQHRMTVFYNDLRRVTPGAVAKPKNFRVCKECIERDGPLAKVNGARHSRTGQCVWKTHPDLRAIQQEARATADARSRARNPAALAAKAAKASRRMASPAASPEKAAGQSAGQE
jgi:hypothetical protein